MTLLKKSKISIFLNVDLFHFSTPFILIIFFFCNSSSQKQHNSIHWQTFDFQGTAWKLWDNLFKGDTIVCFALPYNIYSSRNQNAGYFITHSLILSLCLLITISFYYICKFNFIQIALRSNNNINSIYSNIIWTLKHLSCGIVNQC